jgi:hypothetical protein
MVDELTGANGDFLDAPRDVVEPPAGHSGGILPLARVLALPRSTFVRVAAEDVRVWPWALGLVALTALTKAAVAAAFTIQGSAAPSAVAAMAVRYGSAVIGPPAFAFAAAGLLLLAQRLWQGDAPFSRLVSAVTLALTPLAVRNLVQVGYMAATRTVLLHPGLSAIVTPLSASPLRRAAYALLSPVDAFTLWVFVLLTLAVVVTGGRGWARAVLTMLGIAVLAALVGAASSFAVALLLAH